MDASDVERQIGYAFRVPALLAQALTHRSHGNPHNERLEFLGDSVLNCVIASELYLRFSDVGEGELSRMRSNLVRQQTLAELAAAIQLGELLHLGEGEMKSGGFRRPSILADGLEAVFGAVFMDGGFSAIRDVIRRLYAPLLDRLDPTAPAKDPKTLLQEYLQGRHIPLPVYQVIATRGEAHTQRFEVECTVDELMLRTLGEGTSRRAAEQEAARHALALVAE
jgi:ribonuclease-3